jgi:hypothetical protein
LPWVATGCRSPSTAAGFASLTRLLPRRLPRCFRAACYGAPTSFRAATGASAKLPDGGAYDNLGLEVVDDLGDTFLVAINAGGLFHTGRFGGLPWIRNLVRVNSLLYRQSTSLRQREMIGRFQAFEQAKKQNQAPPEWGKAGERPLRGDQQEQP